MLGQKRACQLVKRIDGASAGAIITLSSDRFELELIRITKVLVVDGAHRDVEENA